jgi:tetratricopeptide (TPR) repeat protein
VIHLKKEPVLALVALAATGWAATSWLEVPVYPSSFSPQTNTYEPKAVAELVLAGPVGKAAARRDWATEPSETKPLPPRALDFPPRPELTVAAVPLDPGPDFRHLYTLRIDGSRLADVSIAQGGEAAPNGAAETPAAPEAAAPGQGQSTRKEREEIAARSYDRIWLVGQASPFFGNIEIDNHDLYELEEKGGFDGVALRQRAFNVDTGKIGEIRTWPNPGSPERIDRIRLAETLRNEVRRRERKVPDSPAFLPERRALITWLLEQARDNVALYDDALRHAQKYRDLSNSDLDGLRLMQRVLRARGDLAGELAMLEALPGTGSEGGFRFEGLGGIKARLGLWLDAESDLVQATVLQPSDCRAHVALAEFLRQRGRTEAALAAVRRAEQTLGSVQDPAELARVRTVITSVYLAVGDLAAARACFAAVPNELQSAYLEGCIAYAASDLSTALLAFQRASTTAEAGAAAVGQIACLVAQGQVQEAHDQALRAYEQDPLQRHRIATCLAAAFARTAQYEAALLWIDRALEADPQDPYAYYLRGRVLHLSGQIGPAEEVLAEALRRRDDFVHAIAEMSAVLAEKAGSGQVAAAVDARRYADRAVALVTTPSVELFELQGLRAFDAADANGARAGFAAARDLAPDERRKWYSKGASALVDYSRGMVDEAANVLQRMTQDLPRDDGLGQWAQATLDAIDDHAQKETLGDGFERAEPGQTWEGDADAALKAEVHDGRLVFRKAAFTKGEVKWSRLNAAKPGKNFLAVGVSMQQGPGHQGGNGDFAGLGIEVESGNGNIDLQIRLGIREGKPALWLKDGRDDKDQTPSGWRPIVVPGFVATGVQQLELRVVPRGDPQAKQFALHASWNGDIVFRHDLKFLTGNLTPELKTVLFAQGATRTQPDIAFDDYRLERRKDTRR